MQNDRGDGNQRKPPKTVVDGKQFQEDRPLEKRNHVHTVSMFVKIKKFGKTYKPNANLREHFSKIERSLSLAQRQTSVAEVIRAIDKHNPKTKMVTDEKNIRVLSEGVADFISLSDLIKRDGVSEIVNKINTGQYKDFGKIIMLALLTTENDLHFGNIGLKKGLRFVKIDSDWACGRVRYMEEGRNSQRRNYHFTKDLLRSLPKISNPNINNKPIQISQMEVSNWFDERRRGVIGLHPEFLNGIFAEKIRDDMHEILLRWLVMPDACFLAIEQHQALDNVELKTTHLELMHTRLQALKAAIECPDFIAYLATAKAQEDIKSFIIDLSSFKLAGKKTLSSVTDNLYIRIDNRFKAMRDLVKLPIFCDAWNNQYLTLVDSDLKLENQFGETHLTMACHYHDQFLFELILKNHPETEHRLSFNGYTPLLFAIYENNIVYIDKLLQLGCDVNVVSLQGYTSLMLAAGKGNFALVEKILNVSTNVNLKDNCGKSALAYAAESGSLEVFNLLLSNNAYINILDSAGMSLLPYAVKGGNADIVDKLLEVTDRYFFNLSFLISAELGHLECLKLIWAKGVKLDMAEPTKGYTPLIAAIIRRQNSVADYIIEHIPANVLNIQAKDGSTALMKALETKNIDIAKLIVARKDNNVLLVRLDNQTALMLAVTNGTLEIVNELLKNGADKTINFLAGGYSALALAVSSRNWPCVKLLLSVRDIDVFSANDNVLAAAMNADQLDICEELLNRWVKEHPVSQRGKISSIGHHAAVFDETGDVIRYLVKKKVYLDERNAKLETPIMLAINNQNFVIMYALLQANVSVTIADLQGRTPLMQVVGCENVDAVKAILSKKQNVNLICKDKYSALILAVTRNRVDIAFLLLNAYADPNLTIKADLMPLTIAFKNNNLEMAALLIRHGANATPEQIAFLTALDSPSDSDVNHQATMVNTERTPPKMIK